MSLDYKAIGFKSGLEVHQELEGHKLFCKCPTIIKTTPPDFQIKRYIRASASELGQIDVAARFELLKKKYFLYDGYNDVTCLVELDESPPESLNQDAVKIALQVALFLKAEIVDEIQFMRKIIIDGSATSGFQRTALVALNGVVETSQGKVSIPTICLEEDAAKTIEVTPEYKKYNLSRLGIPLVEIATSPDIKTPEHAKEVAEKVGMILRSIQGVKRGLGTIRQDVNVSIKGSSRVELKGFQDLRSMPRVIQIEVERQIKLLGSKEKISPEVRKVEADFTSTFLRPMPGAQRMYPETDVKPFKITRELVKSIKLPELLAEKAENFEEKYKLNPDWAREIAKKNLPFEILVKEFASLDPIFIAKALLEVPKELKARFEIETVSLDQTKQVLALIVQKKIPQDAVKEALSELIKQGKINLGNYQKMSDVDLEKEVKLIIAQNQGAQFNAVMGIAMAKLKGKAESKKIVELVKRLTEK
ncbi:Glu-tRNA(Gln) amidotransferase subunit GatE [Candidatus Woesearchaeota archaeon]|nr:Glu-tRNA(Gln) amidotransferase subunit GatE [Candidatus Woesearchaeota archaeon]